jgi:hypothetical protein
MQLALVELNHYKKMYAELAYKLYQSESLWVNFCAVEFGFLLWIFFEEITRHLAKKILILARCHPLFQREFSLVHLNHYRAALSAADAQSCEAAIFAAAF